MRSPNARRGTSTPAASACWAAGREDALRRGIRLPRQFLECRRTGTRHGRQPVHARADWASSRTRWRCRRAPAVSESTLVRSSLLWAGFGTLDPCSRWTSTRAFGQACSRLTERFPEVPVQTVRQRSEVCGTGRSRPGVIPALDDATTPPPTSPEASQPFIQIKTRMNMRCDSAPRDFGFCQDDGRQTHNPTFEWLHDEQQESGRITEDQGIGYLPTGTPDTPLGNDRGHALKPSAHR